MMHRSRIALYSAWAAFVLLLAPFGQPTHAAEADTASYFIFQADEFEYRTDDTGGETVNWDAEAWYGGDYRKIRLKTEGEKAVGGHLEMRRHGCFVPCQRFYGYSAWPAADSIPGRARAMV